VPLLDLTFETYGRLWVLNPAGTDKRGNKLWRCLCECGTKTIASTVNLRRGHKRSCGCLEVETKVENGHKRGREVWKDNSCQAKSAGQRAYRLFPDQQPCEICGLDESGVNGVHRHHIDLDKYNNAPDNIAWLCHTHHKQLHGLIRADDGRLTYAA